MREIIISSSDEGQRINKYLMKYLNEAPSSFIYKMLRKKNITLNEKKAKGEEILAAGDIVKLFLADDTIDKFRSSNQQTSSNKVSTSKSNTTSSNLKVLYEDNDILAVFKPVGILSQKAKEDDYSINEMILDYLKAKGALSETFKPSVCNRLDRNTSGIILAGKSLKGSQELSKMLKDRTADKYYYSILYGKFTNEGTHVAYLSKDTKTNVSEVITEEEYHQIIKNNQSSKAKYDKIQMSCKLLDTNNEYSLVKIKLITGKSHQIRAHFAMLKNPIVGDNKYGDNVANRYFRDKYKLKNQLLHAGLVKLSEDIEIKCDPPEQFINICKGLGLDKDKIWQHGIQEV